MSRRKGEAHRAAVVSAPCRPHKPSAAPHPRMPLAAGPSSGISDVKYRALIINNPDFIIEFDHELHPVYRNAAAQKLTGTLSPAGSDPGRDIAGYLAHELRNVLRDMLSSVTERRLEMRLDTDSDTRYYSIRIIPGESEGSRTTTLLVVGHDITALKDMEDRLRHSAHEWRTTFDAITDRIALLGTDLSVLRMNRACAATLHIQPREAVGKRCYELFHGRRSPCPACACDRVRRTLRSVTYEQVDGTTGAPLEITVSPLFDRDGHITSILHTARDITERKKAEELLKNDKLSLEIVIDERTRELLKTREDLEDSRRLSDIGVLAATIAHEIRNPLAAIRTAAYNIRRKSDDPALESHLVNIDKKVLESDQIIRNLLSYSRIKLPDYGSVSLGPLMEECLAAAAGKYARWHVNVQFRNSLAPGEIIEADPVHLHVLFTNLIDNAYQALPDKTGTVSVTIERADDGRVRISVADNGSGIDKDDLQRIAEPFFTRKSRGIGLGLTICYQIVQLHSGSIAVKSEKDKGTCISITFPSTRPKDTAHPHPTHPGTVDNPRF